MSVMAKRLGRKIDTKQESSTFSWKIEGMGFVMHATIKKASPGKEGGCSGHGNQ